MDLPEAIFNPLIWEKYGRGERQWDIFSRLLKDRIIFIGSEVTNFNANLVVAQILYLSLENRQQDIRIYINSPGGEIDGGLAIYDTMQYVPNDIETVCVGQAASLGAFLLAAGTKGKRFSLPNATIMIHQVMGGVGGTAADIEIRTDKILNDKKKMNTLLAKHTGQTVEQIEKDADRDHFFEPGEAKTYGLIDDILTP
ncbi:MAG: ATP-dependent Clp protease proteolytic subunit [Planctomycetota bacterium]